MKNIQSGFSKIFIILGLFVLCVIGLTFAYVYINNQQYQAAKDAGVDSFETCVSAGYKVEYTVPAQCKVGNKIYWQQHQQYHDGVPVVN